jgi:hypothetical protein
LEDREVDGRIRQILGKQAMRMGDGHNLIRIVSDYGMF